MEDLLIPTGIALIIFALWRDRLQADKQNKELDKYQRLQSELVEAKKEVNVLLQQLEAASEKIVEEIGLGLEEIQSTAQDCIEEMYQQRPNLNEVKAIKESHDQVDKEVDKKIDLSLPKVIPSKVRTSEEVSTNTVVFPAVKNNENRQKFFDIKHSYQEQMPPKHQMVCSMARMGYSEEEIAKQMSIGKGEVRLILKLKRKGEEANA